MDLELQRQLVELDYLISELNESSGNITPSQKEDLKSKLELSWVCHDNSLDGIVLSYQELVTALESRIISDVTMLPVCQEIRSFKNAIMYIVEFSTSGKKINLDLIKTLDEIMTPPGIGPVPEKGGQYRREMPLHRTYSHDISTPDKISYQMRKLVDYINMGKTNRPHPVLFASEVHFRALNIFPFPKNSGKVARLLMNLILMREGYPVAILHSTERQRYYEILKTSSDRLAFLVAESMLDATLTQIRYIDEHYLGKGRRRHTA